MAADTDNVSALVAQLLDKLASLDNQVQLYRQDMAHEFQRHSRELLEDVPRDVAAQVEQAVADSLHNYPVLNPGFSDLASSIQADQLADPLERIELDKRARAGSRSPPPNLPHTSGVPPEQSGNGPRSPHEREREFHGLFTPSYLPLLEAAPRPGPERRSVMFNASTNTSTSPRTSSSSTSPLPRKQRDHINDEPNSFKDSSAPSSSSLATVSTLRPHPSRRYTEETLSSVTSDDSASRSRPRSALRRSSSSSTKTQSPRRVRFEVEGTEVLPTMSPMLSPRLSDLPPSPLNSADNILGPFEEDPSLQGTLASDYNDDDPVTELLGSSPPRPKKVSSTDRLKALARNSTEDTSKWTVVGDMQGSDDDEDELVMGGRSARQRGALAQAAAPAQPAQPAVTHDSVAHRINDARLPSQLSAGLPVVQEHDETSNAEEEGYDSSESDELMMPARRSKSSPQPEASSAVVGASAQTVPNALNASMTETSRLERASHPTPGVDEEDLFDFDDENQASPKPSDKKTPTKYIEEEEEEENPEAASPTVTPLRRAAAPASLPSASRNVNISKPPPPPKSPTSAMASALMGTSMGSYKGRPIILGSVKNEQLHEQVSRMGNFASFVGSVDGRTGVDEKGSYRPEGMSFTGTPKSLSERMLKEELEEEEAARRGGSTTS
ncbi:uncharacterized protein B0I36DRAFT_344703 [Microdochium trichocladiopsis]|uniref:Uncharacterized protein n=1 Tax=Microdochium trichocladiopsis TaxID=1682393 RepID=A0A9P9BUK3_9PEZI|nr:uncharacterized protein B0I36DRAFT_344703 [Microdochium trichocladiopsis]KAH7041066.1 hypothetical protein B0I36DRAFT_344703 [Microdochium trichocladiopsis]